MVQLLRTFGGLLSLTPLLGPPALLLCWALARFRRRDRPTGLATATAVCDVLLVLAAVCVLYLVTKPMHGQPSATDLEPGKEIGGALDQLPGNADPIWQVVGNALLLMPIGMLAPLRITRLRSVARVVCTGLVLSTAVELTQYLFLVGRVAATDDVILNTIGAGAGALLTRHWWARRTGPFTRTGRAAIRRTGQYRTVPRPYVSQYSRTAPDDLGKL
ncbi:VanZ family protein [Amycolatopsis nigrescens]|uniref:VanZ family protein n=1 Tax=Amycolatopsis nigrescens TaxID=381445 RepID=UPI00037C7594|nr:VanZ family protein [Amycolatopsis nigrescens]